MREAVALRVKDVDTQKGKLEVRDGKGDKDRDLSGGPSERSQVPD